MALQAEAEADADRAGEHVERREVEARRRSGRAGSTSRPGTPARTWRCRCACSSARPCMRHQPPLDPARRSRPRPATNAPTVTAASCTDQTVMRVLPALMPTLSSACTTARPSRARAATGTPRSRRVIGVPQPLVRVRARATRARCRRARRISSSRPASCDREVDELALRALIACSTPPTAASITQRGHVRADDQHRFGDARPEAVVQDRGASALGAAQPPAEPQPSSDRAPRCSRPAAALAGVEQRSSGGPTFRSSSCIGRVASVMRSGRGSAGSRAARSGP